MLLFAVHQQYSKFGIGCQPYLLLLMHLFSQKLTFGYFVSF